MKKDKNIEEILSEFDKFYVQIKPRKKEDRERASIFQELYDHYAQKEKIEMKKWLKNALQKSKQQGRDEALQNVGYLRQWLNEDRITDNNKLVENKDILYWLNSKNS